MLLGMDREQLAKLGPVRAIPTKLSGGGTVTRQERLSQIARQIDELRDLLLLGHNVTFMSLAEKKMLVSFETFLYAQDDAGRLQAQAEGRCWQYLLKAAADAEALIAKLEQEAKELGA